MGHERLRNSMCGKKVSYRTKAVAQTYAERHKLRVYECPICFCFHVTKAEKEVRFVPADLVDKHLTEELNKLKIEHRAQIKKLRCENHALQQKIALWRRIAHRHGLSFITHEVNTEAAKDGA